MVHVPDDLPASEPRTTQGDIAPAAGDVKTGLLETLSIRSFQPDQRLIRDAIGSLSGSQPTKPDGSPVQTPRFLPPVEIKKPPAPTFLEPRREANSVNGRRP